MNGSKKKKSSEKNKELKDELGDIQFTLICMANSHGIDLWNSLRETIDKYNKRDADRWEKETNLDSLRYWKFHNFLDLKKATTYSDLGKIATDVLQNMPQPIGQVCGPISTGGCDSVEENLKYFNLTIEELNRRGYIVFNQMPFEVPMQEMKIATGLPKEEANKKLLEEFYYPIFESGLIKRLYFMHSWKTSHGSRIERQRAIDRRISIETLPVDFLDSKA